MEFPDDTFDLVWACESGEHMPDKKKYVEEMTRVLKPGGTLVIACWCQREETPQAPFSEKDKADLKFLYEEWAHPFFISIQEFERLMNVSRVGGGLQEGEKEENRRLVGMQRARSAGLGARRLWLQAGSELQGGAGPEATARTLRWAFERS